MSTHVSDVKLSCFQNQVHTERASVSLQTAPSQDQRVGTTRSFQDKRGHEKRLTRASPGHDLSSKNLCIRQRIVPQISTPEKPSDSAGQPRFTSLYSARFPSKQSDRTRTSIRTAKPLRSNEPRAPSEEVRTEPEVQHVESFCEKRESTPKDEDVSKSHEFSDTHYWPNHTGHGILEGPEHGIALVDKTQPTKNASQRNSVGSDHLTELPGTESESTERKSRFKDPLGQNAEGSGSRNNLIPVSERNGPKASTDCQFSACSSAAIKQALSLPSFPEPNPGNKPETESHVLSSTEKMITSTLVSVLAPHWSGRLQRHKRGLSEGEPGLQWNGPNTNRSGTNQNIPRRSLFLNHDAPGERLDQFSNKLREATRTNRYSAEWKESPQNLTSPLQSRREAFRTSSLCPDRETMDQRQEFAKDPRPSLSLQLNNYRRMSQSVDHAEPYSSLRSRPTTSTLLLSGRRTNSRQPNSEPLQMNKQLSTSVSALNVAGKSILGMSQQNLHLVSKNDPPNGRTASNNFSVSDRTWEAGQPAPPSTRAMEACRRPLFLRTSQELSDITNENLFANDISNKPSQVTTRVRLFSIPAATSDQPETLTSLHHDADVILEKQEKPVSNIEPKERTITDHKSVHSDKNSNVGNPRRAEDFLSTWSASGSNGNSRFVLNHQNLNSHQNPVSSSATKSPNNQTSTPNVPSSTLVHAHDGSNITSASPMSPKPIWLNAPSSSSRLTSVSSDHAGHGSTSAGPNGTRTFTDSLSFSPKRDFSVEGPSTLHKFQNYLNSRRKIKESNESSVNQANPRSPSEFPYGRGHTSSIYSYLRETTPSKTTQMSPTPTSSSPLTSSLKQDRFQILKDDKKAGNYRFSFDYSPIEHNGFLTRVSPSSTAPQSLPPDTGRPVPRLSKSPYSTLISSRQGLNSTSSSPGPYHIRSLSTDSTPVDVNVLSTSLGSEVFDDNQVIERQRLASTVSIDTLVPSVHISSKNTPVQASTLNSNNTHPEQADAVIKKIPPEEHNGMFSSQHDKAKICAADVLHSKAPLDSARMSKAAQGQENLQTCEELRVNRYSKNSHFLLGKKDNVLRSAPSEGLEESACRAGEKTEFKSTKKVEQLLYTSGKNSNPSKGTKTSYFSIPIDKLRQRTPGSPTGSGPNRLMVRIEEITVSEDNGSQKPFYTRHSDSQPSTVKDNTQPDTASEKDLKEGIKGILSSKGEKDYIAETNSKGPTKTTTVCEAVQEGTVSETHETLQGNPKSKRSIFSLIGRKDNIQTASGADNGEVIHKKGDVTGFKTKKMLNRLKLTLGVKSEGDDTVRKKSENQQVSDPKAFNISRKEEPKRLESPTLKTKHHNSEITSMIKSGIGSSPVSGLKAETEEILSKLENHKRLDVHKFLHRPRSPSLPRSEPAKKEEERDHESSSRSQKSPNSQITFLRESAISCTPLSEFKPESLEVSPRADDHKRLDVNRNRFLGSPVSSNYPKLESVKKEEERSPQCSTSPKSPNSQISFMRVFGNSNDVSLDTKSKRDKNLLNTDNHERTDRNRRQLLGRSLSPNWPKPDVTDRSATLPRGGKSSLTPSQSLYSIDFLSDEVQDDNVFFSPTWRRNTSFGETEDPALNWDKNPIASRKHSMGPFRSSSCVDLMYGLPRGRSISVSSVVSGRPSGPGRISTGSKQGSVSDLSSLDGFVSKSRHSSIGSPIRSLSPAGTVYSGHVVRCMSGGSAEWSPPAGHVKSPVLTEASSFPWDTEINPTPPPSPPASRRISQVASPSSTSSKSSPDCLSPRGFLPSRSYKTTLSVFEESDSETTTDDEYYLNSDDEDEQETEL